MTTSPLPPLTIGVDELLARRDDPRLVLVDVLPRASYAAGHLPGALSLPLEELALRAARELPDRDAELALYCGGPD